MTLKVGRAFKDLGFMLQSVESLDQPKNQALTKKALHPFCWSHRLVRIFQTTEAQIEEEDTEVNGFGFRLFLERRIRHAP